MQSLQMHTGYNHLGFIWHWNDSGNYHMRMRHKRGICKNRQKAFIEGFIQEDDFQTMDKLPEVY